MKYPGRITNMQTSYISFLTMLRCAHVREYEKRYDTRLRPRAKSQPRAWPTDNTDFFAICTEDGMAKFDLGSTRPRIEHSSNRSRVPLRIAATLCLFVARAAADWSFPALPHQADVFLLFQVHYAKVRFSRRWVKRKAREMTEFVLVVTAGKASATANQF
jgi:hypothetical protein